MKRLCVILALLLFLCACGQAVQPEEMSVTTATTTTPTTTEREIDTLPAKAAKEYASVIQAYSKLLRNRESEKYEGYIAAFMKELDVPERFVAFTEPFYFLSPLGCAVYDINKDGVSELIVADNDYVNDCRNIRSIFTLKNGKPILLGIYGGNNYWCDIDVDGTLYAHGRGGAYYFEDRVYTLPANGTEFCLMEKRVMDTFDHDNDGIDEESYYFEKDGVKTYLSREEYSALESFHVKERLELALAPITP